jgi:lycopene cyclase CruP
MQEWNISRHEFEQLVHLGLLTRAELERCIVSEFNPVRMGFPGMPDVWIRDVLNTGVLPRTLIAILKDKFLAAGGVLLEQTAFKSADVAGDGVRVRLLSGSGGLAITAGDVNKPMALNKQDVAAAAEASVSSAERSSSGGSGGPSRGDVNSSGRMGPASPRPPQELTCRLLIDCMGHYSPITKQIRGEQRPDGMVLVVGGCMEGVPPERNTSADLLYSFTDSSDDMQVRVSWCGGEKGEGGDFSLLHALHAVLWLAISRGRPQW